jgi:pimeloyl-ACP methyl ester carboxylesterase
VTDGPPGFVVTVEPGDRIHFQDWSRDASGEAAAASTAGEPTRPDLPGILLIHGLGQTTWAWAPVARRLAAIGLRVVAMDLRGHGLSDAPTEDGAYDLEVLADDVVAVAEGSDLIAPDADRSVVLAGHGFGAIVAVEGALALGERCAGLVLVDGGWERIEAATGQDVDEFLRGLDEPPEVMASLRAYLRDRRNYDPATWDDDQEAAARATVVETRAGRVVPSARPHAVEASVRSMYAYDPLTSLATADAPATALVAVGADPVVDEARLEALAAVDATREARGLPPIHVERLGAIGHNLMRYRPTEVTAEIESMSRAAAGRH